MNPGPKLIALMLLLAGCASGGDSAAWLQDAGARSAAFLDPSSGEAAEQKLTAWDGSTTARFGYSVAGAGDLDGDGHDEVIAGAAGNDAHGTDSGSANVFYGSAAGIDPQRGDRLVPPVREAQDYYFGVSVSGAGDLDGDGYHDVIVGASGHDTAYLYYGSATGLVFEHAHPLTGSASTRNSSMGISVSGAGDLDGDGYDDIIVGACNGGSAGEAYVSYGSSTGIDGGRSDLLYPLTATWSEFFGFSVSGAGDVDHDGYDDVIVGAYYYGSRTGAAYVYLGSATGIDPGSEIPIHASDGSYTDYFGWSVSGAGDLDGDGYDDVIVGAMNEDAAGTDSGSAYVYYGSSTGIDAGRETKLVATDGASEDHLGVSVSGAGDLDGDGYDDVVVGAYHDADSGSDAGSVYLWYGSSTGIDLSTELELHASDGAADAHFGSSVANAGDLDGDGTEDLIVGAYGDAHKGWDAGAAYVYHRCIDDDGDGVCSTADCDDTDPGTGPNSPWFPDADGDGWGGQGDPIVACEPPAGHADNNDDCDDGDAAINPAAMEFCDSVDNDCDGTVDNHYAVDASTWYRDADGDGHGSAGSPMSACDPGDGWASSASDCDDRSARVHPGATELCDGLDNDCDGTVDDVAEADATPWYADDDGDGFGAGTLLERSCAQPSGSASNDLDCDDGNPGAYPEATELCDGADNDCDGTVDEDDAADAATWYADDDGDGFGDASSSTTACAAPSGYVSDATDCDDSDPAIHPSADELCDDLDNNCDGVPDDEPVDGTRWYADSDGDGFGDPGSSLSACEAPSGYLADATDCDDGDAAVQPGADETCNGIDDDCDGTVDEDDAVDAPTWYGDADGDGYGDAGSTAAACEAPSGFVADNTDCDDDDAAVSPGVDEICDGIDDDCDGTVDEDDAVDASSWFADVDGDGFGDAGSSMSACEAPSGFVADASDCDDDDATINPAADELCDHLDNDCDGTVDEDDAVDAPTWYDDVDVDGYGDPDSAVRACDRPEGYRSNGDDCDDHDPTTYPGATDVPDDGIDQDCDGMDAESPPEDTAAEPEPEDTGTPKDEGGKGCSSTGSRGVGGWWLVLLAGLIRRRTIQRET